MPAVIFTIQLPDGVEKKCYSPSTIVRKYFAAGEEIPVMEFLDRSRKAYTEASERVRAKYGFACGAAAAELAGIEETATGFGPADLIRILSI
jgi:uncharacterized repeat protein (TIGR04042 family)